MAKARKKLTPAQKRAKKKAAEERRKKYMWVFMNGKQVRVKRPQTIDGIGVEEFIRNNADPIWLHQHERWEEMEHEVNEEMHSYITNFCGEWKDREGNKLLIEPVNHEHVYVTYVRSGDDKPLLRPWFDNMPASKMIGSYDPAWEPSLNIELSMQGDGFLLSLDFHFEDVNYNIIAPSIIRNEEDNHFEKYYYLFGELSPYTRLESDGAYKTN